MRLAGLRRRHVRRRHRRGSADVCPRRPRLGRDRSRRHLQLRRRLHEARAPPRRRHRRLLALLRRGRRRRSADPGDPPRRPPLLVGLLRPHAAPRRRLDRGLRGHGAGQHPPHRPLRARGRSADARRRKGDVRRLRRGLLRRPQPPAGARRRHLSARLRRAARLRRPLRERDLALRPGAAHAAVRRRAGPGDDEERRPRRRPGGEDPRGQPGRLLDARLRRERPRRQAAEDDRRRRGEDQHRQAAAQHGRARAEHGLARRGRDAHRRGGVVVVPARPRGRAGRRRLRRQRRDGEPPRRACHARERAPLPHALRRQPPADVDLRLRDAAIPRRQRGGHADVRLREGRVPADAHHRHPTGRGPADHARAPRGAARPRRAEALPPPQEGRHHVLRRDHLVRVRDRGAARAPGHLRRRHRARARRRAPARERGALPQPGRALARRDHAPRRPPFHLPQPCRT